MQYYRAGDAGSSRLLAVENETVYDLTSATGDLATFTDLARTASVAETGIDEVASRHCTDRTRLEQTTTEIAKQTSVPVVPEEVWAAGVTYEISEQAREDESTLPEIYENVYDATRPEIFFKATPSRTVGPGEEIGIRADSNWNVPEPELGVVLYRGEIVGYTVGNDVSSREIEGENPLYLPQAKVYDRCCALGPCVTTAASLSDPHDLELSMQIERDDTTVYEDATSTAQMVRTVEELVSYYCKHNTVPQTAVLLTGTSLVPEDEFTLQAGDTVSISIEAIGTLENEVTVV